MRLNLCSGIDANLQVPGQDQELEALKGLYRETGGESWSSKNGWLTDSDHCGWYGIKCNEDGFVSSVELQGNRLVGKFPFKFLSELKKLEKLDISENKLTGMLDPVTVDDFTATYIGGSLCQNGTSNYLYTLAEHEDSVAENAGVVTAEFCDELCRGDKISTAGSDLVGFEIWDDGVKDFVQEFQQGSGLPGKGCSCLYSGSKLPLPLKDGVIMNEENPAASGPVQSVYSEVVQDTVCYGYTPPKPVRMESCCMVSGHKLERSHIFPGNSTHSWTRECSRRSTLATIT